MGEILLDLARIAVGVDAGLHVVWVLGLLARLLSPKFLIFPVDGHHFGEGALAPGAALRLACLGSLLFDKVLVTCVSLSAKFKHLVSNDSHVDFLAVRLLGVVDDRLINLVPLDGCVPLVLPQLLGKAILAGEETAYLGRQLPLRGTSVSPKPAVLLIGLRVRRLDHLLDLLVVALAHARAQSN